MALRVYELIHKKRLGQALTGEEVRELIRGYVAGEVPDYQMSAWAMAVCLNGMTPEETTELTLAMAESGDQLEWSDIPGVKVDKHSTGGVGDTTTLVLAPLVAAVGVPVVKMSGRGLGHTGGTIDKLESIPGFNCQLSPQSFRAQVRQIGLAVAAQTRNLAPADKKLYALRDVTDTVQSIPLIASSIMSKKLASGADAIVLDVKVGDGAFMKDIASARELAQLMVAIGRLAGRSVTAVLTRMEEPLGAAIGNALEVREAIQTLRGQGPKDLTELCLVLGAEMVVQAGKAGDAAAARQLLEEALASGRALDKFKQFVRAQGGDERVADDLTLLTKAPVVQPLLAPRAGVVRQLRAEAMGLVAMRLGAGRSRYDDVIDPRVGLVLRRKVGERVLAGEPLLEVHAASTADAERALAELQSCIEISNGEPFTVDLVLDIVRDDGGRDCRAPIAGTPATTAGQASAGTETGPGTGSKTVSVSRTESEAVAEMQPASVAQDVPPTDLLQAAKSARERAYVPYSHFAVGAALRLSNGEVVSGANIENASYGLTNCAERTAVFQARMLGLGEDGLKVTEVVVVADSPQPVSPCGACRQVLAEFCAPDTPVWLANLAGDAQRITIRELLPHAFHPDQMRK
jgi:pyrimidine-nucleoside phosphorylase